MRTLATKQPAKDSVKQEQHKDRGRSPNVSPLSTGKPLLQRQCACGGGCPSCQEQSLLQTKLKIGEPGDQYEQEADRVAEQVLAPLTHSAVSEEAPPHIQRFTGQATGRADMSAPASVDRVLSSSGSPLDLALRQDMEHRFGHDFSQVRVHTDATAEQSAQDVSALAYTVGNNIVFGAGQFAPATHEGRQLLAHELVHTVQQGQGVRRNVIQRRSGCSSGQDTIISDDHARARTMLSDAISTVSSYDGSSPTKVFNALSTHFHGATSNAFATWINVNLRFLWSLTWMAGYECYTGGLLGRNWACSSPNELATTFWCVPAVDIRLCPPYFGASPTERSTTMIHEWIHKYGCNFDLGYEHEPDYPTNLTVTQLLNADSFSSFIRDVQ